jgi:hypothetical protein
MSMQPGSVPPPPGGYPPQQYPPVQYQQQLQMYGHPPYARNDEVLVAVTGSVFPQICPRCGQPGTQQKTVKLQYIPPWARFFGALLAAIVAKRATVQPWFCAPCLAEIKKKQILGGALLVTAILGLLLIGFSLWIGLLGVLLFIPAIIVLRKAAKLQVKVITKDTVTLKNTHPGFRAALPIAP